MNKSHVCYGCPTRDYGECYAQNFRCPQYCRWLENHSENEEGDEHGVN
jgi:hypothetical protein